MQKMKKLESLKLNALSKSNLKDREMGRIYGGNYCAFEGENKEANTGSGKCSCACSGDYYGSTGLNSQAEFYKYTTSWGTTC